MHLHHDKHHAAYVSKLNSVLAEIGVGSSVPLHDFIRNISNMSVSQRVKDLLRFNAGGHYNHLMFWSILAPGGMKQPTDKLLEAIDHTFGNFEKFKADFEQSAMNHLGSGWTWLFVNDAGNLAISSTLNHNNPLMSGHVREIGAPILVLDLWEHAYYLKYNNRKADYIKAFWDVVNFEKVAEFYAAAVSV
jgi:Fe-Mn family superoxide dismutase